MNPPLREAADRDAMLAGHRRRQRRRHRDRPRAASLRREAGRVRPRAVRHHRPRDGGVALLRPPRARGRHLAAAADRAAVGEPGADPRRARRVARRRRAGRHHDPRAGSAGDGRRRRRMRSKSKNTPFDGWQLRGGVAATIVGGRTVYVNEADGSEDCAGSAELRRWTSDDDDIREKALKDLQQAEVLMVDGHFDYGNGYHGRVYLNPHQLFRHPSTIWRFAQDLIDLLPARARRSSTEVVAGPGDRRRAARAHDRRAARQPPQPDASAVPLRAVQLRSGGRLRAARRSIARELERQARAAGRRRAEHRRDVRALRGARAARPAARSSRRWRSTIGWKRSPISACRTSRSRSTRRRRTTRRGECPLCKAGVPITQVLSLPARLADRTP